MAAGKSKIGKRVARALGLSFLDTDKIIVAAHGPIPEIFEREGEAYFRQIEREAVVEALKGGAVVSLGGGAVLDAQTRGDLGQATVVFLTVRAAVVEARLGGTRRPLLSAGPAGGLGDWQRIYDERRPIYEELASIRFDTSNRPIDGIVDEIVTWVREKS
ncbi:shikimate kinase [Cryobacterium frigoriphilum]|nr:shikimate kinase [Cryobacterium frigoriphilum]